MDKPRFMTVVRHIIEEEKMHPEATGELSRLLSDFTLAAKVISLEVNKAGLVDILGFTGDSNVHGEKVKKLDMFAHDMLIKADLPPHVVPVFKLVPIIKHWHIEAG